MSEQTHKGQYNIILADPPWSYRDKALAGKRGSCCKYTVQDQEWIKSLKVNKLAAEDCCLFLWVTMPKLNEVFEVISNWGFEYKTCAFTWIKKNKKADSLFWGMGRWTRANSELCLLATKGNPKRVSAAIHSVVMSPVEEHSKKPDEVRNRIIQLCGDLPRIELFAREKVEDWDCIGNELDGKDIKEILEIL